MQIVSPRGALNIAGAFPGSVLQTTCWPLAWAINFSSSSTGADMWTSATAVNVTPIPPPPPRCLQLLSLHHSPQLASPIVPTRRLRPAAFAVAALLHSAPKEPDGSHPTLGDRAGPILNPYTPPLHDSVRFTPCPKNPQETTVSLVVDVSLPACSHRF